MAKKKTFKGNTVQAYADVPARTFDLLPRYIRMFSKKDDLFACKVDGKWKKYSGMEFFRLTNLVSVGLMNLGVMRGDRVAVISNNCPYWNMVDFGAQQVGAILVPIYPTVRHSDYVGRRTWDLGRGTICPLSFVLCPSSFVLRLPSILYYSKGNGNAVQSA